MRTNHLIVKYFFLLNFIYFVKNESFSSESNSGNLGTAFEFKIHVDAGKEECFYQYINPGSSLYVSFQVMRGGDGNAGFYINNPTGQTILPYQWKAHAELDDNGIAGEGYYALCIDNKPSSFQSKLVSLYLASFKRDEWEKYVEELSNADVTANNATNYLRNIDYNINEIVKFLEHSKLQHIYDWYIVKANNRYIQNWSILQCIVCITCSIVQVYFVRKLFQMNDFGKGKVRA